MIKIKSLYLKSVIGTIEVDIENAPGSVCNKEDKLWVIDFSVERLIKDERTFWQKVKGFLFEGKHFTLKQFMMTFHVHGWADFRDSTLDINTDGVGNTKYLPEVVGYGTEAWRVSVKPELIGQS
jgi:hypothetical protein